MFQPSHHVPRTLPGAISHRGCRFCGAELNETFVNLGVAPLANSYLRPEQLESLERYYPLQVFVCRRCFLVQLPEWESPDRIFSDYAYFSSYSDIWLAHARQYVEQITRRLSLGAASLVVEVGSNDGYLLQYFLERKIPVLGIDPAANVAHVAVQKGIPTLVKFFGSALAMELVSAKRLADLIIVNNVLANVTALNDFIQGLKILLKPGGLITLEFPHLLELMRQNQFDTIYHEHFSYFSFTTVHTICERHGLVPYDVEEYPTHGGSLRLYVRHAEDTASVVAPSVQAFLHREEAAGLRRLEPYRAFTRQVEKTKRKLLRFLIDAKEQGKSIAAYGAPAKGNTLLNYCGIRTDFIDYTMDRSPHKQGHYLPGSRIPIFAPEKARETRPDFLLILPWNLREEIMAQMSHIREWGGQFVVPIPEVQVWP